MTKLEATRKVLVSRGFGAGWSTWSGGKHGRTLATYKPLIDYIEGGGSLKFFGSTMKDQRPESDELLAILDKLDEVTGEQHYRGGVYELEVVEVSGPFRIDEYDGSESVIEASDEVWW